MENGSSEGKLIVIVAPSGTGKSTLIKQLKDDFPELKESVSYTTRPLRKGEVHGHNYFYISESEFLKKRDSHEFLEWAKVHSNYYGTSKNFVNEILRSGQNLLLDLDVQGADAMKKYFAEKAHVIFIEPPSLEILSQRLHGRGTEDPAVIEERLSNARREISRKNDYDYLLLNDDFQEAYKKLKGIFLKITQGQNC